MEKPSEQEEIKDIISSREDGFGQRLKTARNESNLTTAEVARELRLDEKIILALESEDHARLPASAFVCGYIRNYAKLLRIQPEPLIDCYKKEISTGSLDPELKVTKGKALAHGIDPTKLILPMLTGLIIVALFLGAWKLWDYYSNKNAYEQTTSLPGSAQEITEEIITKDDPDTLSLPAVEEVSDILQEETAVDSAAQGHETEMAADDNSLAIEPPEVAAPVIKASDSEVTDVAILPTETTAADSLAGDAVQAVEQQSEVVEQPLDSASISGDHRLVLEFTGDSWIVIKDAEDKKLASGLKRAGQTLHLEGRRPNNVFLGDGRVVTVSIGGKIFDHSRYINSRNIARFKVE